MVRQGLESSPGDDKSSTPHLPAAARSCPEEGCLDQPLSLPFLQGRDGLQEPHWQRRSSGCPEATVHAGIAVHPASFPVPLWVSTSSVPGFLGAEAKPPFPPSAPSPQTSINMGGSPAFWIRWEEAKRANHPHACRVPSSYSCCDCI